jgi:phosphoribosyl 1,2-cyclic phosphate phosphodiesterase
MCVGFAVSSCQMPHGPVETTGYRFDYDGKSISYATDFSEITRSMVELFSGCDILVADCLRREPHPTHANLAMALELAEAARVGRVVLTHLDKSLDYQRLSAETADHVLVGFDGMELIP